MGSVAAALVGGCGQPGTPSGPHLQGTLHVQGDYDITTSFDTPAQADGTGGVGPLPDSASCSQYAKGFGTAGTFEVPQIDAVGDTTLYLTGGMTSGYSGPGTYSSASNPGLTGEAVVSTSGGQGPIFATYRSQRAGSSTLIVSADGSGKLTLTEWGSTETRGTNIAGALDGTLIWTCH